MTSPLDIFNLLHKVSGSLLSSVYECLYKHFVDLKLGGIWAKSNPNAIFPRAFSYDLLILQIKVQDHGCSKVLYTGFSSKFPQWTKIYLFILT